MKFSLVLSNHRVQFKVWCGGNTTSRFCGATQNRLPVANSKRPEGCSEHFLERANSKRVHPIGRTSTHTGKPTLWCIRTAMWVPSSYAGRSSPRLPKLKAMEISIVAWGIVRCAPQCMSPSEKYVHLGKSILYCVGRLRIHPPK